MSIFDENQIRKKSISDNFQKAFGDFWLKLPFSAPPKTLVRISERSDLAFTVFARSGETGRWTPNRFGRLRVKQVVVYHIIWLGIFPEKFAKNWTLIDFYKITSHMMNMLEREIVFALHIFVLSSDSISICIFLR